MNKNKKYGIIALAISVAFVVSCGFFLLASENETSEISTVTFELKEKKANAPGGTPGPPEDKGGGNGGGGGGKGYKLLKGGVKIQNPPATYVINPANFENIDESTVMRQVENAVETWDDNVVDVDIHADNPEKDYGAEYDEGTGLDDNEIDFGTIDGSGGTIAVTHIVYNNSTKAILEFDIRFDNAEEWGVYGTEEYEDSDTMDLINIATHEAGHTLFLDDLTDDKYKEMTMYGYLTKEDEIYKRTLAWGDSDGVNELY